MVLGFRRALVQWRGLSSLLDEWSKIFEPFLMQVGSDALVIAKACPVFEARPATIAWDERQLMFGEFGSAEEMIRMAIAQMNEKIVARSVA